MNAVSGVVLPDVIGSAQGWMLQDRTEYERLSDLLLKSLCGDQWMRHADREDEWSGSGVYFLQVRVNRPEGRPLYSLKWEGV